MCFERLYVQEMGAYVDNFWDSSGTPTMEDTLEEDDSSEDGC